MKNVFRQNVWVSDLKMHSPKPSLILIYLIFGSSDISHTQSQSSKRLKKPEFVGIVDKFVDM